MPHIDFTQYLMPNGRRKTVSIERPTEVYQKAKALMLAGYRFEIEVLSTGEIHMDCSHGADDEGPVAVEVCANGPDVPIAVDRLVDTAARVSGVVNVVAAERNQGRDEP